MSFLSTKKDFMGTVVMIVLICLLLFNLVGLFAFIHINAKIRHKLNSTREALECAKSLVSQKNATVKQQQAEINRLTGLYAEMENRNLQLKSVAADLRGRYVAAQNAYDDLRSRHAVMEKTLGEKAARLATIEQYLREAGEPPLKTV
jgi:predicted  nucleic acid-binding Zn-ribbon protein